MTKPNAVWKDWRRQRTTVRHELAERLRLRRPPELYFQVDRTHKMEGRVEELLERAKKRSRKKAE